MNEPRPFMFRMEHIAVTGIARGISLLRWETACRIGARLGATGYAPLGIRREVAERQIAAAFPEKTGSEVRAIARASFEHLGRSAAEVALLPKLGRRGVLDLVVEVEGWEVGQAALAKGRGAVLVAGHHGNWELLGAYLAARGVPIDAVVRRMANPLFDAYLNETRAKLGITVIRDEDAVKQIPRSFREGRMVGLLSDQGVKGLASTFVPFFGRPAKTPRGAAVFGLRFDTPIVFAGAIRRPDGKYRVVVEPVTITPSGDKDQDVDAMVERFSQILEKWVRRYPEQYLWQHRRWRRQPPDTPPELGDPTQMTAHAV
jgi:KDO2-lipid IV(A) lauroyltransferase